MMAEEAQVQIPNRVTTKESNRPVPTAIDRLNWIVTIGAIIGSICGFVYVWGATKTRFDILEQTLSHHIEVDELRQTDSLKSYVDNHSPYREDQKTIANEFLDLKKSLTEVKSRQDVVITGLATIGVRQEDMQRRLGVIEAKLDKQNETQANSRIHDDYER
jgi:hypothetical protein